MKKYLTFLILCSTTLLAICQTSVPGGTVSGTWSLAGSPYLIQGSIQIPNDSTLTIMPGVTVNFQSNYQLQVRGRLLAIGTAADTIIFTAANWTIGWQSIRFPGTAITNDTSKIIFCKLEHGKATGSSSLGNGGAICITNFSKVIVSHCSIANCTAYNYGGGIFCDSSNVLISYNTIANCTTSNFNGGGIACGYGSPAILYNTIINNVSFEGGGIFCESLNNNTCHPIISHNIISGNSAYGGGGITASNSTIISYNIITNNSGAGGMGSGIDVGYNAIISNNIIANNSPIGTGPGGGIYCLGGSPYFENNTIVNNSSTYGGAVYCKFSSTPTFRNCILWGNTATNTGQQVYLFDEGSDPNFYYCDIQGGSGAFELNGNFYTGTYQNNIDINPLCVSPSGGSGTGYNGLTADWSLQTSSPCINTGDPNGSYPPNDIVGNPRVVNGIIDIGAYEYQGNVGIADYVLQNQIMIYPNPFRDELNVIVKQNINSEIIFYDIASRKILLQEFSNFVSLNMEQFEKGIYIYEVRNEDGSCKKGKIVKN
jgi:hypothetical protein